MSEVQFTIESVEGAAVDLPRHRVFLRMTTAVISLTLEIPTNVLMQLAALCLYAIGKSELNSLPETAALLPEATEAFGFPDGRVGLRAILPGGAPLTFVLEPGDAQLLGASLVHWGDSDRPVTRNLN